MCENPNAAIYKFEGFVEFGRIDLPGKISLNADNVLLRGMSLRNTEYVYGVTIFTGHDTKVMKNSANSKYKFSKLELLSNFSILIIFCTQVALASLGAILGTKFSESLNSDALENADCTKVLKTTDALPESCFDPYYLDIKTSTSGAVTTFVKYLGTWILIFTNFVPISLMVSLELVKFWQAIFMSNEILMYDEEQDMQMRAQSSNLNEELGQVEYVFSDKTGTLTCNVMEFKKFSAGTIAYGTGQKPSEKQLSNVNFHDPQLNADLDNSSAANHEALKKTIVFLACCHTIIIDQKKGTYNSSSPDELALVNAAKQFGFEFKDRDDDDNIVVHDKRNGVDLKYQLLNVCEFTSTRKRMSVIFREPSGKIILMCKGADTVIEERLSHSSKNSDCFKKTAEHVNQFAEEGLRTLYLA